MFAYLIQFPSQQVTQRVLNWCKRINRFLVLLARSFLLSRNCNPLSLFSASVSFGSLSSARHSMSMSTSSVTVYFYQSLYFRSNTPPLKSTKQRTGFERRIRQKIITLQCDKRVKCDSDLPIHHHAGACQLLHVDQWVLFQLNLWQVCLWSRAHREPGEIYVGQFHKLLEDRFWEAYGLELQHFPHEFLGPVIHETAGERDQINGWIWCI